MAGSFGTRVTKQELLYQTKALAERYHRGKHAGQSLWFPTQFDALDKELLKPDSALGLVASVLMRLRRLWTD
jgi:hypothetical protein